MALIACKECGGEVSSKAKTCPKCGIKLPKPRYIAKAMLILFFLLIMASILGKKETRQDDPFAAFSACKRAFKNAAHDPDSVEFENIPSGAMKMKDGSHKIFITGRAKNGFGALRKFTSTCTVRFDGNHWIVDNLKDSGG